MSPADKTRALCALTAAHFELSSYNHSSVTDEARLRLHNALVLARRAVEALEKEESIVDSWAAFDMEEIQQHKDAE